MSHTNQDGVAAAEGAAGSAAQQLPPMMHDQQGGSLHASENDTPWRKQARVIRRLVTLSDNVRDLVDEGLTRQRSSGRIDSRHRTARENSLFKTYELLLVHLPQFNQWISNSANIRTVHTVVRELSEGADSARADDTCSLKGRVISWLSEKNPPQPRLSPSHKVGRGFHNDSTARLICPVDYNWDDPEQRAKIREWDPKYLVMANMWPRFLYEDLVYDPNDPVKGLFKGSMLIRAFKSIFTSPSSAEEEDSDPILGSLNPTNKRRRGERRTRTHVAGLAVMKSVEPRAIAYTAVQLRFALSSCGSWRLVDELFDYGVFYENIVRWFEELESSADRAFVAELLLWWNREIFGYLAVLNYAPPAVPGNTSVMASFKRRRVDIPGNVQQ